MTPRRILALLLIPAVLLGGGLLAVHLVLRSDLPRARIADALRDATGLEVDIDAARTSWGGRTRLDTIVLRRPLEDRSLLEVPAAVAEHRGVFGLLFGQDLDITAVALDSPTLHLRRLPNGTWNVADALRGGAGDDGTGDARWPALSIEDLRVVIEDGDDAPHTLGPLAVSGAPVGRHAWSLAVRDDRGRHVDARVVTRAPARHEIEVVADDLHAWLAPFAPELPAPLAVDATWHGSFAAGGAAGRVRLRRLVVGPIRSEGAADVRVAGDVVHAEPHDLRIEGGPLPAAVVLRGGALRLADNVLEADALVVESAGVTARLDGRADLAARRANVEGTWHRAGEFDARGTVTASAAQPPAGPWHGEADLTLHAGSTERGLEAELSLRAEGDDLEHVRAELEAPALVAHVDGRRIVLDGLAATLRKEGDIVSLTDLDLPRADRSSGAGTYDLADGAWTADLHAEQWRPDPDGDAATLIVEASGRERRVDIERLEVVHEFARLEASGRYDPAAEPALDLAAVVELERGALPAVQAASIVAELAVRGAPAPPDLVYEGRIVATDVPFGRGALPEVSAIAHGRADARTLTIEMPRVEAFDAAWAARAVYEWSSRDLALALRGDGAPLAPLLQRLGVGPVVEGELGAEIALRWLGLDPERLAIEGRFEIDDPHGAGFAARRGGGSITGDAGVLRIEDAWLERDEGRLEGTVELSLVDDRAVEIDVRAERWPLEASGADARLLVDGTTSLRIVPHERSVEGPFDLAATIAGADGADFGRFELRGEAAGRTIDVPTLRGSLLEGTLEAAAAIDLDDWTRSRLDATWRNIDLPAAARLHPALEGFTGHSDGRLDVAPAENARALEPLRAELSLPALGVTWRGMRVGAVDAIAYAGPRRAVLDTGRFELDGGTVDLWARVSRHGDETDGQVFATAHQLDLGAITRAFGAEEGDAEGRIDGRVAFGGAFDRDGHRFGTADVQLSRSDVARLPALALLFDALRLGATGRDPTGYGSFLARIEGGALVITEIEYFNRGAQVTGRVVIDDVLAGGESPIDGTLLAAARPFKDMKIPFSESLDRLVGAVQADSAAVRIDGTVGDARMRVVPLQELGASLTRMLEAAVGQ